MWKVYRAVVVAAAFCAASASNVAGVNEWTAVGPPGAYIRDVEYVNETGVALAVSPRRLYRTTDHGASWSVVQSVPFPQHSLLAVNPVNSNQAVAVLDGIYRSVDAGLSWVKIADPAVPVEPNGTRPESIVWTRDGSAVWIGTTTGTVFRSVNGGATWSDRTGDLGSTSFIHAIDADAMDAGRVLALTSSALHRTSDAGVQWSAAAQVYESLATSPTQAGVVLATTSATGEVVRSTDYGATFVPHSTSQPGQLVFAPGEADVVYGFTYSGEFSVSVNQGATWTQRTPVPGRGPSRVAVSRADPDQLLVASSAGVYSSNDGGQSWIARTAGMRELSFGKIYSRATSVGGDVYITASVLDPVLQRDTTGAWVGVAANASPVLGDLYDSPTFAPAPSDGRLYLGHYGHFGISTDGGANWLRLGDFPVGGSLTVHPLDPQNLLVTDQFLHARRSVDGGVSWLPFGADLQIEIRDFAGNDTTAGKAYALARYVSSAFTPLFVSSDGGAAWTPAPWPYRIDTGGTAIAHEPGSASTVYVGLITGGLYRTIDDGVSWEMLDPYPTENPRGTVATIAIDPRDVDKIHVTTTRAYPAKRSVDRGVTWEPLRVAAAEGTLYIKSMVVDPIASHRLLGLGSYGGLFELEISPDLEIGTTSSRQVAGVSGSTVLTVTNDGPYTATGVRLSATLPQATGGYTVQGATGFDCAVAGTALTCEAALLRAAGSLSATVTFTPTSNGQWTASVSGGEPDSVAGNNSLTVTVNAAVSNPPGAGASDGGGGGGGVLDYLLLALAACMLVARTIRTR